MPTNHKIHSNIGALGALCSFLGISPQEVWKHSSSVYQWGELWFEVVGEAKVRKGHKNGGVQPAHYVRITHKTKKWMMRELGTKSLVRKQYDKNI